MKVQAWQDDVESAAVEAFTYRMADVATANNDDEDASLALAYQLEGMPDDVVEQLSTEYKHAATTAAAADASETSELRADDDDDDGVQSIASTVESFALINEDALAAETMSLPDEDNEAPSIAASALALAPALLVRGPSETGSIGEWEVCADN